MDLQDKEPNVVYRLTLAVLVMVILLGLAFIVVMSITENHEKRLLVDTADCLCATNPAIQQYIYATMTANSWTRTPSPIPKRADAARK